MTDTLRQIAALLPATLRGLKPATITGAPPRFEWVDPKTLFVEESYQRDVGESGIALIRRILIGFDWKKFKAPICIEFDGKLVVIDGQHTAIACATHPQLETIPVMIVEAANAGERAAAFVGQNRDRVALTPMAIWRAELVAGDLVANRILAACLSAGARVSESSINLREKKPVGTTIAIGTMRVIAKSQGENFLARVLRVMVAAKRGPIKAGELSAAALILERIGDRPFIDRRLAEVIASKPCETWDSIARSASLGRSVRIQDAIATQWCRELDERLPGRTAKPVGRPPLKPAPAPARAVPAAPPAKPVPKPAPVARPAPAPALRPAPPRPVAKAATPPAKAVPKPKPEDLFELNGVKFDRSTGEVNHRGQSIRLPRPDVTVPMLAALARIMPALMDTFRLANHVFGKHTDNVLWLRNLVEEVNPLLAGIRLEIKSIPRIGNRLEDLGPAPGGLRGRPSPPLLDAPSDSR